MGWNGNTSSLETKSRTDDFFYYAKGTMKTLIHLCWHLGGKNLDFFIGPLDIVKCFTRGKNLHTNVLVFSNV